MSTLDTLHRRQNKTYKSHVKIFSVKTKTIKYTNLPKIQVKSKPQNTICKSVQNEEFDKEIKKNRRLRPIEILNSNTFL